MTRANNFFGTRLRENNVLEVSFELFSKERKCVEVREKNMMVFITADFLFVLWSGFSCNMNFFLFFSYTYLTYGTEASVLLSISTLSPSSSSSSSSFSSSSHSSLRSQKSHLIKRPKKRRKKEKGTFFSFPEKKK